MVETHTVYLTFNLVCLSFLPHLILAGKSPQQLYSSHTNPKRYRLKHSHHKQQGHLCLVDYYFVVTMLLGNKSYTFGKPVYFPFKWCHICEEHVFVG